jgi:DMSO/TMAO reductase YedYZ molybdopterin-dependent catalytic subunit
MRPEYSPRPDLPPNQQLAAPGKWPVVGEKKPRASTEPWVLTVTGLVAQPRSWSLAELLALPRVEHIVDVHCVTRWSKPGMRFGGVPLRTLLDACGPLPDARFLSFIARSERNHSTSLPMADALALGTLVALTHEGDPLPEIHGGPVRTVVPGRYFYKSVKWLERIEVLAEDRLGYWEAETGYHNRADPWREERYIASTLDRQELRNLLQARDFRGRDLLGIEANGLDLSGLNARGAALRNAHFQRANLERACFDGANLSNAHLQGANLRHASFRPFAGQPGDLEGADFRGADLRGVDLSNASLFGATFCPEPGSNDPWGPALLDASIWIEEGSLAALTPVQEEFVRLHLGH